jgi:hypothetical protein
VSDRKKRLRELHPANECDACLAFGECSTFAQLMRVARIGAEDERAAIVAWLESDWGYRVNAREADWSRLLARMIHAGEHRTKEEPDGTD